MPREHTISTPLDLLSEIRNHAEFSEAQVRRYCLTAGVEFTDRIPHETRSGERVYLRQAVVDLLRTGTARRLI